MSMEEIIIRLLYKIDLKLNYLSNSIHRQRFQITYANEKSQEKYLIRFLVIFMQ